MSAATSPRRARRSAAWAIVFAPLLVALIVLALLFTQQEDMRPLSPQSAQPGGAGALSTILEEQGVTVTMAATPQEAAQIAEQHSTVLLTPQATASDESIATLTESAAKVIVTGTDADFAAWGFPGTTTLAFIDTISAVECANPNALAAAQIGPIDSLYLPATDFFKDSPDSNTTDLTDTCFAADFGAAWGRSAEYQNVVLLPDPQFLSNQHLAKYGNAAFAVRELGSTPQLIWVIGQDRPEFSGQHDTVYTDWMVRLFWGLLGTIAVYAIYRGRRFGPLVAEPMPVNVPLSEADTGRAQLYERANDPAYLADLLRASTLAKIGPKLGLPQRSSADDVVNTLRSGSKKSAAELSEILYRRQITNKNQLAELTIQLENLEREFDVR
ncbi:MAG: DUF4350 domain-containing protein [Trueperella sp.]|nr:DUF4350 domain-containing protein [Trueperella sp.]